MEKLFTFGVAVYNQEEFILDTLNSIKWQIITYGNGYKFRLYITDDHSKDRSVEVANEWLKKNKFLFIDVKILTNDSNCGTPYNYNRFLDLVGNEQFKFIAGDDILGRNNIFKQYEHVEKGNIDTYFRLCFNTNGIILPQKDKTYIFSFLYKCLHDSGKKFSAKKESHGGYIHTPSTLYSKQLYISGNCKELNLQFHLFEDDPTWYSMAKNTNCKIYFIPEVHLLYRISDKSTSNSSKGNKEFDKELYKLHKIFENNSFGLEKLYWKARNSAVPKFLRIDKYADKIKQLWEKIYVLGFHLKKFKSFENYISTETILEQKHLEYIQSMKNEN